MLAEREGTFSVSRLKQEIRGEYVCKKSSLR